MTKKKVPMGKVITVAGLVIALSLATIINIDLSSKNADLSSKAATNNGAINFVDGFNGNTINVGVTGKPKDPRWEAIPNAVKDYFFVKDGFLNINPKKDQSSYYSTKLIYPTFVKGRFFSLTTQVIRPVVTGKGSVTAEIKLLDSTLKNGLVIGWRVDAKGNSALFSGKYVDEKWSDLGQVAIGPNTNELKISIARTDKYNIYYYVGSNDNPVTLAKNFTLDKDNNLNFALAAFNSQDGKSPFPEGKVKFDKINVNIP